MRESVRFGIQHVSMSQRERGREGGRIRIGLGAVNDCKNEILIDLLKGKNPDLFTISTVKKILN